MFPFPTPTPQATMTDPHSDIEITVDDDEDHPSDGNGEQACSLDSAAPSEGAGHREQRPAKRRRKAHLSRSSMYDPFYDRVIEDGVPGWKCRVCRWVPKLVDTSVFTPHSLTRFIVPGHAKCENTSNHAQHLKKHVNLPAVREILGLKPEQNQPTLENFVADGSGAASEAPLLVSIFSTAQRWRQAV